VTWSPTGSLPKSGQGLGRGPPSLNPADLFCQVVAQNIKSFCLADGFHTNELYAY